MLVMQSTVQLYIVRPWNSAMCVAGVCIRLGLHITPPPRWCAEAKQNSCTIWACHICGQDRSHC